MSRRRPRPRPPLPGMGPAMAALDRSVMPGVAEASAAPDAPAAVDVEPGDPIVADVEQGQGDVDAGPPLLPPPPSWVELVRELAAEHDLAPLYVDEPERAIEVEGRLWLHPWRRRRDVGALLDWTAHLQGPVSVTRPGPARGWHPARSWDTVWVDGMLAGHPTRLVAHTHRLPTDPLISTDEDLLMVIARQEDTAAREHLDDVEDLEVLADGPLSPGWFDPVVAPAPFGEVAEPELVGAGAVDVAR